MPKQGWDRYAAQKGFKQKGYVGKYRYRSTSRKAAEASRGYCVQCSGQKQEEEIIKQEIVNEERREEEGVETPERGQEGVPRADQGRSEVGETASAQEEKVIELFDNPEELKIKPSGNSGELTDQLSGNTGQLDLPVKKTAKKKKKSSCSIQL